MNTARHSLMIAGAVVFASGCSERTVLTSLGAEEAQRCAIVLRVEGIDAFAAQEDKGASHKVTVTGGDVEAMAAIQALEAHGLPKRPATGFDGESSSLIPTASEERARYIKGLSGEVEALLESVDGVLSAEALVSLPERRPLALDREGEASASIVISHAGDSSPVLTTEVQDIVVRAVGSQMTADRVSVLLKPIVRRRFEGPAIKYERDRVTEAAFLATVAMTIAAYLVAVLRMRKPRPTATPEVDDGTKRHG